MELLLLGMVAGIGFASFALWQRARREEDQAAAQRRKRLEAPAERTPTTIQVGDVVQHLGSDYVVEGVLTLSEDGRGARLYRMFEDAGERFLYAKTGNADPLLLQPVADLALSDVGGTPPETLQHAQASFRQTARVQASVIRVGQLGARKAGERVHLYEYAGPGPSRLLVLDWGERIEAFAGEKVAAHTLEILPSK
jgi:hypothetical protein